MDGLWNDEAKDPEHTNRSGEEALYMGNLPGGHPAANKPEHWAVGGRKNAYAAEDDEDLDDLPEELIARLLEHAQSRGFDNETLKRLHQRLMAKDNPPAFKGRPNPGGSMTNGDKSRGRTMTASGMGRALGRLTSRMAMDSAAKARRVPSPDQMGVQVRRIGIR